MTSFLLAVIIASSPAATARSRQALTFSLKPAALSASRSGPVWVSLSVRSGSSQSIRRVGIPAIMLKNYRGESWWAPFDFDDLLPLQANAKSVLQVRSGKTVTYKIDLANLLWAKSISAGWPSQRLQVAVPADSYELSFEFEKRVVSPVILALE